MKKLAAIVIVCSMAMPALAQPYNARGTFNGWGEAPLNDDGDGSYSLTVGSLTPGERQNFKVAENDWASSWPGSDVRAPANGAGDLSIHFYPGAIADGWNPPENRVGYDDPGEFGWEIMGAFNSWDDATLNAERQMTDMGGGLYSVDFTIATAGTYDWKFRESNSWDIAIGDDFGNSAANNSVTTLTDNEILTFQLDLPNGRWQVVPEPGTLGLLGLGSAFLLYRRRR